MGDSKCQDHFDREYSGHRGQPVIVRASLDARGIVRRPSRCLTLLAAVAWPLNSIANSENDIVCSITMPLLPMVSGDLLA